VLQFFGYQPRFFKTFGFSRFWRERRADNFIKKLKTKIFDALVNPQFIPF
jgi:hypothetical protein